MSRIRPQGLINARIAEQAGCSNPYVALILAEEGLERNGPWTVVLKGRPLNRKQSEAYRAAVHLRSYLVGVYEETENEAAMDAIDALCSVDAALEVLCGLPESLRRAA